MSNTKKIFFQVLVVCAILAEAFLPSQNVQAIGTSGGGVTPSSWTEGDGTTTITLTGDFYGETFEQFCPEITGPPNWDEVIYSKIAMRPDVLSYSIYGTGISGNLVESSDYVELSTGNSVYCQSNDLNYSGFREWSYRFDSVSIPVSGLAAGNYEILFISTESDNGCGGGCEESYSQPGPTFTINEPLVGRVCINSNVDSSGTIEGPWTTNWSGTTACYPGVPIGSYTATGVTLGGYSGPVYSPAQTQNLGSGQTITFNLTYTAVGSPPTIDLKFNNSDGPVTVTSGTVGTLSWTPSGADSCTASNAWSGSKSSADGTYSESSGSITTSRTYTITCSNGYGNASDSVTISVQATGSDCVGSTGTGNCFKNVSQSINGVNVSSGGAMPGTLTAGQTYNASVVLYNSGTTTWTCCTGGTNINNSDGFKLGSQNWQDNNRWGMARVGVPATTAPDQNATFNFSIVAPATPNTYNFQWSIVEEYEQWFYSNNDVDNDRYTPNVVITVVAATPTPTPTTSNVTVTEPDYCVSGPAITASWTYSDPAGSAQSAYQVQVSKNDEFTEIHADSGKVMSGSTSWFSGQGLLQFNTTYRARVRTWNLYDVVSSWQGQTICNGPGCAGASNNWKTPPYAYPQVDFYWTANGILNNPSPPLGKPVDFTDQTVFNGNPLGRRWSWTFGNGGTSVAQNPSYTYSSEGSYYVTLTATDNANQSCLRTKGPLIIQKPIPQWREIAPR